MAEVGSWYVTVMPNMQQFNRTLASAAKTSGTNAGGIFNTAFGVALGSLASGAIRTAFDSLGAGIARLDTLENFPRVMENIGVATEDVARSAVKDLAQRLEGLPTRLDDATASVQRFALANGDIETSVEMFDALNNALLSGGSGAELQAAALEQVSQAYAKGKPDMMEWRSMLQTMGPALQMVAASWNMTVEDMGEALRQGEIPMQDFFDTLIELNGEGINGLASLSEQASVSTESLGTALGLIPTRISNAWAQILDAIGREDLVAIIDGATSGMLDAVSTYVVPAVQEAKQAFDDFLAAAQPISDALGELVSTLQAQFAPVFESISTAITDNLPSIQEFVDMIAGLVTFITDNIETIETFALAFLIFNGITAILPILTALGGVLATIGSAITVVMTGLVPLSGVLSVFGIALNPVPLIIAAIAGAIALLIVHFDEVKAAFETFATILKTGFEAVKAKVTSVVTSLAQGVINKFKSIVDFVKSIPSRIVGFFSNIGSRITSAIGNIHFPMPHVTWEEVGLGIKLPKVKWYAQGGFVNGAQLIGAGEAGTELIWPSYGRALDRYGASIAEHMPAAGTVYNVYMNDVAVNDNAAIRADVMQLLMDMQRYGAMNRG